MAAPLHVRFTRDIARALGKLPVCPPGADVEPGDIVCFPAFRRTVWGRAIPQGTFQRQGRLEDHIGQRKVAVTEEQRGTLCYRAMSARGASYSFGAGASATPAGHVASGAASFTVDFNAEGASYLAALGCWEKRLSNLQQATAVLSPELVPADAGCFLVVSVVRARVGLVMQAGKAGAKLALSGDAKLLVPAGPVVAPAAANLGARIETVDGANFTAEWDEPDGRPVLLNLVRIGRDSRGDASTAAVAAESVPAATTIVEPLGPQDLE